ncbi:unnamed protein product [Moneuplotes crassus]|uniref:RING-type domain-containing protein n=1 Tax=Euplotes crassus TaxID=5936 RepID=A0AAD1XE41_EUPCR|nr:unnamed protein product [Moneuplotes crassus]
MNEDLLDFLLKRMYHDSAENMKVDFTCCICLELHKPGKHHMCPECSKSLCDTCIQSLKKSGECPGCKKKIDYDKLPINRMIDGNLEALNKMKHAKLCGNHSQEARGYCLVCRKLICFECQQHCNQAGHSPGDFTLHENLNKCQNSLEFLKEVKKEKKPRMELLKDHMSTFQGQIDFCLDLKQR